LPAARALHLGGAGALARAFALRRGLHVARAAALRVARAREMPPLALDLRLARLHRRVALARALGHGVHRRLALRRLDVERQLRVRADLRLRLVHALERRLAGLFAALVVAARLIEILRELRARHLEVGVDLLGEALDLDGRRGARL